MIQKRHVSLLIVCIIAIAGVFFFFTRTKNIEVVDKSKENGTNEFQEIKKESPIVVSQDFFVSGWLPYWAKEAGAAVFQEKIRVFSEINPFAYGVDALGNLIDTARMSASPWPELIAEAKKQNVKIIPTILWGDASAMHTVFSDSALLNRHTDAIVAMLKKNDFSGVDIDYEGKNVADRDVFTLFLKTIHEKLVADGDKTLNCTVEARTEDVPPTGFTGTRAMSFANDFSALDGYCDSVRIMAYDEVFQIHRANVFVEKSLVPAAPNADKGWVEEVMRYALRFIAPEKLVLGVPTYGWEFRFQKVPEGYRYERIKSVSYPEALAKARSAHVTPIRTEGGELSFTYQTTDGAHIVTIDDGESVADKIALAEKLHLKGISLFKIDGLADPKIFNVLESKSSENTYGNN